MAEQPLDLTPEQQEAYDKMRAEPGILLAPDGTVVFDGEAEARGVKPFTSLAEIEAHKAALEAELDDYGRRRDEAEAKGEPWPPTDEAKSEG